jgi:NAD(P)H dehydrogenase (quinone)
VRAAPVPRESWAALFRSQGTRNPEPRMRMLDGFNESWIDFQDGGRRTIKGSTSALEVIAALGGRAEAGDGLV